MNQNDINAFTKFAHNISNEITGFSKLMSSITNIDTEKFSEEQKKEVEKVKSDLDKEFKNLSSLSKDLNNII
jgi:hypothetical protein